MKYRLIILSIFLFNCKISNHSSSQHEIPFEVLTKGSHGGYTVSEYLVVKNSKTLKTCYSQINKIRKPGIPIPKIDFEQEMVVALFMGEKSTGGFSISIKKIEQSTDTIYVYLTETRPEEMAASVITQPFYFCKLPRSENEVVFKKYD